MAQRKPIVIDGCVTEVKPQAKLAEIVSPEVRSVVTHDGKLIPRERFSQVQPPVHFTTNLSHIQKGGGPGLWVLSTARCAESSGRTEALSLLLASGN